MPPPTGALGVYADGDCRTTWATVGVLTDAPAFTTAVPVVTAVAMITTAAMNRAFVFAMVRW